MKQHPSFFAPPAGLTTPVAQDNTAPNPWLFGTIRMVEASREMIFLHVPGAHEEQIVHWLPKTRFLYHGTEVRPDDLHDGQQVSMQYLIDGGKKYAMEIDIIVQPPAVESMAPLRQSLWPSRSARKARDSEEP